MGSEASGSGRWIVCPVCRKGNPVGTLFCRHCWGAVLNHDAVVTSEQLAQATSRRRAYLRRRRLSKIAFSCLGFLVSISVLFVFYCYTSDVFVKPPVELNSDSVPGEWSMFRRDLKHSAVSQPESAVPEGKLKWIFNTEASIQSSPTVIDGTVYFGSRDSTFYALDAKTGSERWTFKAGSWVDSSPAVVDGTVYFGSNDGYMYALDAGSGGKVWSFKSKYPIKSSPAVADGKLYFRSDDYYLYALDKEEGTEIWKFFTGSSSGSSPAISDGIVIIGSGGGYLYCLNADNGQRRLRFATYNAVSSSPAVSDGAAYFSTDSGYLWAVDYTARTWLQEHELRPFWTRLWAWGIPGVPALPTQTGVLWGMKLAQGATSSSPLLTGDLLYIGSGNRMIAVNISNHEIRWEFETGGLVRSSPVIAGSAVIFGSEDGLLYAVDSATGEKLWDFVIGDKITSSPTVSGGVVYAASYDGNLYAIE